MPISFLLDEHLRGPLWRAIERHNLTGPLLLDAIRVGDRVDLPLGMSDPDILLWTEREGRIVVSRDRETMRDYFERHLLAGHHAPGLFLIRPRTTISAVLEFLILAAHVSQAAEWVDQWRYIP